MAKQFILQCYEVRLKEISSGHQGMICDTQIKRRTWLAYRLASLANDSSSGSSSHLDVGLQFDLLLWPEEILLLQFAIDSALSLEEGGRGVSSPFNTIGCSLVDQ